jgi:putative flippase GtrA
MATARKVVSFALVSVVALGVDFLLFVILLHLGLRPEIANFVSATLACAVVYFSSTRRIFAYQGRFLKSLFLVYLGWQFFLVTAASWAVGLLVGLGLVGVLAKALTLPVTFSSNFLFMQFLTKPRPARSPSNTSG